MTAPRHFNLRAHPQGRALPMSASAEAGAQESFMSTRTVTSIAETHTAATAAAITAVHSLTSTRCAFEAYAQSAQLFALEYETGFWCEGPLVVDLTFHAKGNQAQAVPKHGDLLLIGDRECIESIGVLHDRQRTFEGGSCFSLWMACLRRNMVMPLALLRPRPGDPELQVCGRLEYHGCEEGSEMSGRVLSLSGRRASRLLQQVASRVTERFVETL